MSHETKGFLLALTKIANESPKTFITHSSNENKLDMEVNKEKEISLNIPTVSFNIPTHISLKAISFIISYHVSS